MIKMCACVQASNSLYIYKYVYQHQIFYKFINECLAALLYSSSVFITAISVLFYFLPGILMSLFGESDGENPLENVRHGIINYIDGKAN